MVNFRFHLVSLTAVFLALAIGIGIGATVVDRASVEFLERRLDDVEARRDETNRENNALSEDLSRWNAFSEQAGERLVAGAISQVPVLVVAVEGTDQSLVDSLRAFLSSGGAVDQGVLWLSGRLAVETEGDLAALAQALGTPAGRASTLRSAFIARLAGHMTSAPDPGLVTKLVDVGLVRLEGGDAGAPLAAGTKLVLASSSDAKVPNGALAVPLVGALAASAVGSTVAVEAVDDDEEEVAVDQNFVLALRRSDPPVSASTVDNAGDWRGRVAVVLAVQALTRNITGDYGTAAGSQRLLPEAPSS